MIRLPPSRLRRFGVTSRAGLPSRSPEGEGWSREAPVFAVWNTEVVGSLPRITQDSLRRVTEDSVAVVRVIEHAAQPWTRQRPTYALWE